MDAETLDKLEALHKAANRGPWKHERGKHTGDDWLIASFGEDFDNISHQVTTHGTHASECNGEAGDDAALVAAMRTALPELLRLARVGLSVETACAHCRCPVLAHAVDDEERRECTVCGCGQYTSPTKETPR